MNSPICKKMNEVFDKIKDNLAYITLAALESECLVGTVMGVVCYGLYGTCEPFLVIEDFIVSKEMRRTGIGKELLSMLENEAKRARCTRGR